MAGNEKPRVLCVDDDPNVLDGLSRHLRRHFAAVTAVGGPAGLEAFQQDGAFPVVLTDLKMPEMDGLAFIERVQTISPDTVCVLLTGNADLQSAISAVNDGNVFRFLTKPCPPDTLVKVLGSAWRQYQLKIAERDVLERTLGGSVKLLTEILSIVNPIAFSRASRVKSYVRHIVAKLGLPHAWHYELAAMLSQIGCVTLPPEVLDKAHAGATLTAQEKAMFASHPTVAQRLLANVPRLERVAAIVGGQHGGVGEIDAENRSEAEQIVVWGCSILRLALDLDGQIAAGNSPKVAVAALRRGSGRYDPRLLAALDGIQAEEEESVLASVAVKDLNTSMTLEQDVKAATGTTVVGKGQALTVPMIERLKRFAEGIGIVEPIRVRVRRHGKSMQ